MSNQSKSIAIITAPVTLLNESAILFKFPVHKKDTFTNTAIAHHGFFWFVCLKKKCGKGQRIHHSLLQELCFTIQETRQCNFFVWLQFGYVHADFQNTILLINSNKFST